MSKTTSQDSDTAGFSVTEAEKIVGNVLKRDGSKVAFDIDKIVAAIMGAMSEAEEGTEDDARQVAENVLMELARIKDRYATFLPSVEGIQDHVEKELIKANYAATAKAYILYRHRQAELRERNLFRPRQNLKPYEYPELAEYVDAIRHSYWIHTEFNYTSDINDYKANITDVEQSAIKNSMLAIAQIEVAVKTFWGDLYKKMPKPEIGAVGYTFAESEVRHMQAYSHLLEILGLNGEFKHLTEVPVIKERIDYLNRAAAPSHNDNDREYTRSIFLFSLFVEHVSLFSQFLIIMAFQKHKNLFKGISNVVEATSKEEQIHGLFGIDLVNQIKKEEPRWFDDEYEQSVRNMCREAMATEEKLVDWIFEAGELDFLPKQVVHEFLKHRMNNSLKSIGYAPEFDTDKDLVAETAWFNEEVIATKHVDFFQKRSINYSKKTQSVTSDDLF
ncbi:MAG: ribonucleotide-diphosphate reductase subunit beta [Candidatus Paceibacterota bacterium]